MNVILVSGTPGTGKTTVARKIARKNGYKYIDANKLIIKNKLYMAYDNKLRTRLVDTKILNKFLIIMIKNSKEKGMVIDSHLSHHLPARYADLCIITKTDLKTLNRRLRKRKYSEQKITENMQAEILNVCLVEALQNKHKIKVIRT